MVVGQHHLPHQEEFVVVHHGVEGHVWPYFYGHDETWPYVQSYDTFNLFSVSLPFL